MASYLGTETAINCAKGHFFAIKYFNTFSSKKHHTLQGQELDTSNSPALGLLEDQALWTFK